MTPLTTWKNYYIMPKQEGRHKIKWKGMFSFRCEMEMEYCFAYTEKQAWLTFCRRLSKKHDVSIGVVTGLFDGSHPNYHITHEEKMGWVKTVAPENLHFQIANCKHRNRRTPDTSTFQAFHQASNRRFATFRRRKSGGIKTTSNKLTRICLLWKNGMA